MYCIFFSASCKAKSKTFHRGLEWFRVEGGRFEAFATRMLMRSRLYKDVYRELYEPKSCCYIFLPSGNGLRSASFMQGTESSSAEFVVQFFRARWSAPDTVASCLVIPRTASCIHSLMTVASNQRKALHLRKVSRSTRCFPSCTEVLKKNHHFLM